MDQCVFDEYSRRVLCNDGFPWVTRKWSEGERGNIKRGQHLQSQCLVEAFLEYGAYRSNAGLDLTDQAQFKYGVSKAGLEHLTVVLATEFARRSIPVRVNAIVPGHFVSQRVKDEEELNEIVKMPLAGAIAPVPLLRAGKQEEMVMAAVYLGSSGGGYSNGTTLSVDGGWGIVNL